MRHLISLVASLVAAPLIWLAGGYGFNRLASSLTVGESLDPKMGPALAGLCLLIVAGALYAGLVLTRISPVGPVVVGVVYAAMTFWITLAPQSFLDTMPDDPDDYPGLYTGMTRVSLLLAIPLLLTALSPRRWRQDDAPRAAHAPAGGYQPAAPGYPPPGQPPFPGGGTMQYPPPSGSPVASPYAPAAPSARSAPAAPAQPGLGALLAGRLQGQAPSPTEETRPLHSAAQDEEKTRPLYGTPPPPSAYPRPSGSDPTSPPIDPDRRF